MNLTVNGRDVVVPETIQTVRELIEHFDLQSPVIIVEHNDVVLEKGEHENATVKTGDKVEFVQFVGGG